ncbi:hypothetical protein [Devosia sp.]|uniref:hypothetical protein n=2 Tax=unclassified Devosia TaxID=196773 RepID=UPI0025C6F083|nr:hypothetical protein [Devosia sp.]
MAYIVRAMKIVRTSRYVRDLKRLRVSAGDVARLEQAIVLDPAVGDVIPGLSGIRKLRFGFGNQGKRGGGRAIYFLMLADDVVVMLHIYAKNEKGDLTSLDRRILLGIAKEYGK